MVLRIVTLPVRLGAKTTLVTAKTGYRTGRLLGFRRMTLLGIGIGIGLLLAPMPGRQLRAKLRDVLASAPPSDPDLSDRVRFELSHSPRTWHLPQPGIDVRNGKVVLSGEVPHATARADLEVAAASVSGVSGVDNLLKVTGTNGQP